MLTKKYQVLSTKYKDCRVKDLFSHRLLSFVFVLCSLFFSLSSNAQCAMCRAALETEDGGNKAAAVNDGIVYLMAFPYLLVGGLGYYIYRTRLQKKR